MMPFERDSVNTSLFETSLFETRVFCDDLQKSRRDSRGHDGCNDRDDVHVESRAVRAAPATDRKALHHESAGAARFQSSSDYRAGHRSARLVPECASRLFVVWLPVQLPEIQSVQGS